MSEFDGTHLQVGALYSRERTQWPERGEYNFRAGVHELRLFWRSPSVSDVEAVNKGAIHIGLMVRQPALWFLYRIEGASDWSDASYSIHLVDADERGAPPALAAEERALLVILLVDADTGILRALRVASMSPRFSRALHAAIGVQLAVPFDAPRFHATLAQTYTHYPRSKDMARDALIIERAGAR